MAIYSAFAEILDYPTRRSLDGRDLTIALECPDTRHHIDAFQNATAAKCVGELQELYIDAFDLRPDCTPNLGYHLFGDDGRRGLFLAELKGRMHASGIELGSELPDHLSLILRYMESVEEDRGPLIEDCILPALTHMAGILDTTDNPYRHAVRALLSFLKQRTACLTEAAGAVGD